MACGKHKKQVDFNLIINKYLKNYLYDIGTNIIDVPAGIVFP